ncbi:hypothetical protein C0991_010093, partial [Blastosporella zonata]
DFVTLPVQKPYASLKSLGKRKAGEILGAGILGEPKLEERDDGAPVTPEGSEESRESESAKLVWRLTNEPATEFKQVTRRVGELQEMEASMADYTNACERECTELQFALLRMQTTLGETWTLQGVLLESRREAEEALWGILAFE